MNQEFFSVLVQVAAALGLAGMILLLSILMGKRSSVRKPADIPYECGMIPMGEGAPMFSVKFYMVAHQSDNIAHACCVPGHSGRLLRRVLRCSGIWG